MSVFANLKEIEMANLQAVQPPQAAIEMTIAEMVKQAHKGVLDLQDRMTSLCGRAGIIDHHDKPDTAPTPAHMRAIAQDLLRQIAQCHAIMADLERIA
jgi:hypothetical protein